MKVNVTPFYDDFDMMPEVPVFHAAVAHDCHITGNSTILIINNELYIIDMEHNLLSPISIRPNGLLVENAQSSYVQILR